MNVADEHDPATTLPVHVNQNVSAAPQDGQKIIVTAEGKVSKRGGSLDDARIVK